MEENWVWVFFPHVLPCAEECSAQSCAGVAVLHPALEQLAKARLAQKRLALKHQDYRGSQSKAVGLKSFIFMGWK